MTAPFLNAVVVVNVDCLVVRKKKKKKKRVEVLVKDARMPECQNARMPECQNASLFYKYLGSGELRDLLGQFLD